MVKEDLPKSVEKIETTIGELIEAVTQIALESGRTEEEGYALASLTIENMLRRQKKDFAIFVN